ncbi:peroxiredoxin [Bradyrhizobium neotropicale]|uniref:peroxiredoxin n=1 Tax=Bradyrhizobium neotropicale TaxID=1497615 RepID=UPI0009EEC5E1|nr:peroxiredoxin [Bradyrhizobium neotropicale]
MSKKSRKNSSKSASGSPIAKKKAAKTRPLAQTKPAKTRRAPASKSSKTAAKAASHKAAPKRLKSSESLSQPATAAKLVLTEGRKAPAFRLPRDGGGVATLSDYAGRKLVLFFYPRADTPGCTREAIDFTRLADAFAQAGTAVLGISADPVKAQERFRDKHSLGIPLVSDETHEMLEAYGAWGEKSMYGRTFLGILRTTVLVGADGKVAKVWRNVRVDGHADDVLAAASSL